MGILTHYISTKLLYPTILFMFGSCIYLTNHNTSYKSSDKQEDINKLMKVEFNKDEFDVFGLPIKRNSKGNKFYCFKDEEVITDTISNEFVITLRKVEDKIHIKGISENISFEGQLKELPYPELEYRKTYNPATFMVDELRIFHTYPLIRVGEWTYSEGNVTRTYNHDTVIDISKVNSICN